MNTSVIAAFLLLIAVILIWLFLSYKAFLKLKYSIEESFETTEVYLKKRHELVAKLIKLIERCNGCGPALLEEAAEVRNAAKNAETIEEKVNCENECSQILGELLEETKDCSDLAKNPAFEKIKKQLCKVEEDAENFARFYNTLAKMLNTRVRTLPSSLVAKLLGFTVKPMLDTKIGTNR